MIKNKLINYLQRLWYELNWFHILSGFRYYFRRWQVVNYPKMGRHEPVIYVANHQNAFLDALAIIMSQKRHPLFLVRANIFASTVARFYLRSLNMLPIYRMRDGVDNLSKNDQIIQDCIDMLHDGRQPLAIFVEGNHSMMRSLRPLKKGVGRIAFSAIEQSDFKMNLKIVPIGIAYSKHSRYHSDLLVNFGTPILVNDLLEIYHENPNKAYLQLNKTLTTALKELIVNIEDREHYETIEKAWISQRAIKDNMFEELHNDQQIIDRITKEVYDGKMPEVKPPKIRQKNIFKMIIGFPFFIYGMINHLPIYYIMRYIVHKVVTDIHFYGSIKLVGSMYLGPPIYLLQAWGVYMLTGHNIWLTLFYFFSLPFFGNFAHDYYQKYISDDPYVTSSADLLKGYK